ncbi:hypothetical protein K440DRAFT_644304 [Wilcoxina mikolae CBS 423.85]|nr:hypothetical protein K440DRAFT_644304 [Wilcoxina mikolae CBS 423.85]
MEAITACLKVVQRLRTENAVAIEESKKARTALNMIKERKVDKRKVKTKARLCTGEYLNAEKAKNPRPENETAKEYKMEEQKGVQRQRNSEENMENTDVHFTISKCKTCEVLSIIISKPLAAHPILDQSEVIRVDAYPSGPGCFLLVSFPMPNCTVLNCEAQ